MQKGKETLLHTVGGSRGRFRCTVDVRIFSLKSATRSYLMAGSSFRIRVGMWKELILRRQGKRYVRAGIQTDVDVTGAARDDRRLIGAGGGFAADQVKVFIIKVHI